MRSGAGWAVVLWACLGLVSVAHAQSSFDRYGGARAGGLGLATTALAGDAGGHVNPALRALHARPVAIAYARQAFGLSDLRYGSAHVALPVGGPEARLGAWTASGGAGTFGTADYRELHVNAGAATTLSLGTSRGLHVGANARYHHTRIAGYGSGGALAMNVGVAVEVVDALLFGAHGTNLLGASLAPDVPLPQTLAVGLGYAATDGVRVVADAVKDLDFPLALRGGLEVQVVDALALRAGAATQPTRFTAGTGVRLGPVQADLAAEQHPELGWSSSASLLVSW